MNIFRRKKKKQPTLGLALSGGGARGLAHIGVLKALKEAGIKIDYLAGTSMGGVIAAAYAVGMPVAEIEDIAMEYSSMRKLIRLADPSLPRQGMFHGERLKIFFEEFLKGATFDDLRIPLTLVAVDLVSGEEVHLQEGPVVEAVRATISVPGLLEPALMGERRLIDGGMLNNLPADVARNMGADVVLAVDVFSIPDGGQSFWHMLGEKPFISGTMGGLISVMGDSLYLVMNHQNAWKLRESPPDFLVKPLIPDSVTLFTGFDQAPKMITEGRIAVLRILDDLKDALKVTHR